MAFKVMTFNIQGWVKQGPFSWDNRVDLTVRAIREHAPDLIGFQELTLVDMEDYRERLPEYQFELGPEAAPPPHLYDAILWNPETFDRTGSGGFWLSETPNAYNVSWGSSEARVVNWVRLRERGSGAELVYLNTHMDHVSVEARQKGAVVILQQITLLREGKLPVILSGDFNANAYIPPDFQNPDPTFADTVYKTFLDNGFVDSFIAAGNRDSLESNTFHNYVGRSYLPSPDYPFKAWRIDWILTLDGDRQLHTLACDIIRYQEGERYPSDHYPVMSTLEFAGEASKE